jgi:hypothetical protein
LENCYLIDRHEAFLKKRKYDSNNYKSRSVSYIIVKRDWKNVTLHINLFAFKSVWHCICSRRYYLLTSSWRAKSNIFTASYYLKGNFWNYFWKAREIFS